MPAGNPDGGQWTEGGGGTGCDSYLPDNASDDQQKLPVQLVQLGEGKRYSVDLDEEEVRGGHTQRDHVGKSDADLLSSMYADQMDTGLYGYSRKRQGSFESRESANNLINRTLEQNRDKVDLVAKGYLPREFLTSRFGFKTGREAFRSEAYAKPYVRDAYGVGVEIRHDPGSPRGYRVLTAYPRNEQPK